MTINGKNKKLTLGTNVFHKTIAVEMGKFF